MGYAVEMRWEGRRGGFNYSISGEHFSYGECSVTAEEVGVGAGGGLEMGGLMPTGSASELITLVLTPQTHTEKCSKGVTFPNEISFSLPLRNCNEA